MAVVASAQLCTYIQSIMSLALEHCVVKVLAHQCQWAACGDWLLHAYACGILLQVPIQHKMIIPTLLTQAEVSSEHASLTLN